MDPSDIDPDSAARIAALRQTPPLVDVVRAKEREQNAAPQQMPGMHVTIPPSYNQAVPEEWRQGTRAAPAPRPTMARTLMAPPRRR